MFNLFLILFLFIIIFSLQVKFTSLPWTVAPQTSAHKPVTPRLVQSSLDAYNSAAPTDLPHPTTATVTITYAMLTLTHRCLSPRLYSLSLCLQLFIGCCVVLDNCLVRLGQVSFFCGLNMLFLVIILCADNFIVYYHCIVLSLQYWVSSLVCSSSVLCYCVYVSFRFVYTCHTMFCLVHL